MELLVNNCQILLLLLVIVQTVVVVTVYIPNHAKINECTSIKTDMTIEFYNIILINESFVFHITYRISRIIPGI